MGNVIAYNFASRQKSRLSTKTKFWPRLHGCISVKFMAALSCSTNCFKDIRHRASSKYNQYPNQA